MRKKVFLYAFIFVILDQLIKLIITRNIGLSEEVSVIKHFFYIVNISNPGAAWNVFSGDRWFLIIISILAIYGIVKYFLLDLKITKLELVGYSLLLGGVVGNLIDRIVHGGVIDYLNFYIFEYNFPVFNLADTGIVIGALLISIHLFRGTKQEKKDVKK